MSLLIRALVAWLAAGGWPGPSRGERPEAAAQNAACEGCHVEVAREWRGSMHQRAYVDADFAESLAREPSAFCRGCHAPEADPQRPAPVALAQLGVGCVTCHVPGGVVLAGPTSDVSAAPHAVLRLPGFAGDAACGGCHEFGFPERPEVAMQGTLREHAVSGHADTRCVTCHMPRAPGGRRGHGFAASRDPEMLREALTVGAQRRGEVVHMTLTPAWVGHAVPTGDLFRRIVVEAEVADAQWQVLAYDSRALGRRFAAGGGARVPVADDRIGVDGPVPTQVVLDLGEAAVGRTIRWRVRYERVAFGGDDGAQVWDSVTIADGELPGRAQDGETR